jgi:hypothetical protein
MAWPGWPAAENAGFRMLSFGPAMLELLTDPQTWIALLTLTALELVLGIDNIIFISILVDKLPKARQEVARRHLKQNRSLSQPRHGLARLAGC